MAPQPERRADTVAIPRAAVKAVAWITSVFIVGVSGVLWGVVINSYRHGDRIAVLETSMLRTIESQERHDREAAQWKYRIITCEASVKDCQKNHYQDNGGSR